jgi:hypothetical protein
MADKKKSFSRRHGYTAPTREITIREDVPENLRHFVLTTAGESGLGPHALREEACAVLRVRPDSNNWSDSNVWSEVQDLIYGCEWFRVYDFIERIYSRIDKQNAMAEVNPADTFQEAINDFFLEEGIGWQMVNGEIVSRGTESFEAAVHQAVDTLDAAGRSTARDEIHEALADLSRRPQADLTGAVQHGIPIPRPRFAASASACFSLSSVIALSGIAEVCIAAISASTSYFARR